MTDSLGDRMKGYYENITRIMLPRRTYTIIRIDGKSFHTFTKQFRRPFDDRLINMMDLTAAELCSEIQGVKFAYVQSDEISLLLTDFDTLQTDAWYGNNLQKICSVSASIATRIFNKVYIRDNPYMDSIDKIPWAEFDSRVFQIPHDLEVMNYFIWRQQDCTRNSISAVAQSLYSDKELHGKSSAEKQEMIFQKGINWDTYPIPYKRGRVIRKEPVGERSGWIRDMSIPIFTQDKEYLLSMIPERDSR